MQVQTGLADLANKMAKAGQCTQEWDIVCSYSLASLNATLAKAHAAGSTVVRELKITSQQEDPLTGQLFTIAYDITLDAPLLTFATGLRNECIVSMNIAKGSYAVTPQGGTTLPPVIIPPQFYSIVAVVPLAAIRGDGTATLGGSVITFAEKPDDKAHIVLHFKTTELEDWKIAPSPDPRFAETLQTILLSELLQYFQNPANVSELDYQLAGVTNVPGGDPSSSDVVILPKAFVFAVEGNETGGVLSLFIQTTNVTGGAPGIETPTIPLDVLPIPSNYSASLIFSRRFLQTVYLAPQLAKLHFSAITTPTDDATGLRVTACYPGSVKGGAADIPEDLLDSIEINETTVDFSTMPFTFAFTTDALTTSLRGTTQTTWNTLGYFKGMPQAGPTETATTTITVQKTFKLSDIGKVDDKTHTLSLDFSVASSDYAISVDPGASDSCWTGHVAGHVQSNLQAKIGQLVPARISFSLAGLDYFKASNLLFPGTTALSFDAVAGLHIPCDMLVVGSFLS